MFLVPLGRATIVKVTGLVKRINEDDIPIPDEKIQRFSQACAGTEIATSSASSPVETILIDMVRHPNDVEGDYRAEASENIRRMITVLQEHGLVMAQEDIVLNLGAGRNVMHIPGMRVINIEQQGSVADWFSQGDEIFVGDYFDHSFKGQLRKEKGLARNQRARIAVLYNMWRFIQMYTDALVHIELTPEQRLLAHTRKAFTLLEKGGWILFVHYMPPTHTSESNIIIDKVVGLVPRHRKLVFFDSTTGMPVALAIAHGSSPLEAIVDIGAGKGMVGEALAERYPQAKIFLVEPNPSKARWIRTKLERRAGYQQALPNIAVIEKQLGDWQETQLSGQVDQMYWLFPPRLEAEQALEAMRLAVAEKAVDMLKPGVGTLMVVTEGRPEAFVMAMVTTFKATGLEVTAIEDLDLVVLPQRLWVAEHSETYHGFLHGVDWFEGENRRMAERVTFIRARNSATLETSSPVADEVAKDNLGLILTINMHDAGAELDAQKTGFMVKASTIIANLTSLILLLANRNIPVTFDLRGLLKTSNHSRFVHGLDYGELAKSSNLKAALEQKKNDFDIDKSAEIIEAVATEDNRIYLKLRYKSGSILSMMIGYPTKRAVYQYQNMEIRHSEKFGNLFSPKGLLFIQHLRERMIRAAIHMMHVLGMKAVVDFIPWLSPEVLDENYRYFVHEVIVDKRTDVQVLKDHNYSGVVLFLKDGRRLFVRCRGDSQDQLLPDLGAKTATGKFYWEELYFGYLKYFIDTFGVDAFRVDLPGELHVGGGGVPEDYLVIKRAFLRAVEYAGRTRGTQIGKRIYFVLESYAKVWGLPDNSQRDLFRSWDKEVGYAAFKTYYKEDFMDKIRERNVSYLEGAFRWICDNPEGLLSEVVFLTNHDEVALRDMVRNPYLRKMFIALLILLAKSGQNVMFYWRDFVEFSGDIIPIVGGTRDAQGQYTIDHRHATGNEVTIRLEKTLAEITRSSFAFRLIRELKNVAVGRPVIKENKILFIIKGKEIVFDLQKMLSRPLDSENGTQKDYGLAQLLGVSSRAYPSAGSSPVTIFEAMARLGIRDNVKGRAIFGRSIREWAREHHLFLEYPPYQPDYKIREHYAEFLDVAKKYWSLREVENFILGYARSLGEETRVRAVRWINNLKATARANRAKQVAYLTGVLGTHYAGRAGRTDSPFEWALKGDRFIQIHQARQGRLFANPALHIDQFTLEELPIWPVDEDDRVIWDLLLTKEGQPWMITPGAVPTYGYYAHARKVSIAWFTPRFGFEPHAIRFQDMFSVASQYSDEPYVAGSLNVLGEALFQVAALEYLISSGKIKGPPWRKQQRSAIPQLISALSAEEIDTISSLPGVTSDSWDNRRPKAIRGLLRSLNYSTRQIRWIIRQIDIHESKPTHELGIKAQIIALRKEYPACLKRLTELLMDWNLHIYTLSFRRLALLRGGQLVQALAEPYQGVLDSVNTETGEFKGRVPTRAVGHIEKAAGLLTEICAAIRDNQKPRFNLIESNINMLLVRAMELVVREKVTILQQRVRQEKEQPRCVQAEGAWRVRRQFYGNVEAWGTNVLGYGFANFRTLSEALRAVGHEIESEAQEARFLLECSALIDALVSEENTEAVLVKIDDLLARLDSVNVEEKRLAWIVLVYAKDLLCTQRRKQFEGLLRLAQELFTIRIGECRSIIDALLSVESPKTRAGSLRQEAVSRNDYLLGKTAMILRNLKFTHYLLTRKIILEDLLDAGHIAYFREPEFNTLLLALQRLSKFLEQLVGPLAGIEKIQELFNLLRDKIVSSRVLLDFRRDYHRFFAESQLDPQSGINTKKEAFSQVFLQYSTNRKAVQAAPQLYWTIFYQAVFVSPSIEGPKKSKTANPLFLALSNYITWQQIKRGSSGYKDGYPYLAGRYKEKVIYLAHAPLSEAQQTEFNEATRLSSSPASDALTQVLLDEPGRICALLYREKVISDATGISQMYNIRSTVQRLVRRIRALDKSRGKDNPLFGQALIHSENALAQFSGADRLLPPSEEIIRSELIQVEALLYRINAQLQRGSGISSSSLYQDFSEAYRPLRRFSKPETPSVAGGVLVAAAVSSPSRPAETGGQYYRFTAWLKYLLNGDMLLTIKGSGQTYQYVVEKKDILRAMRGNALIHEILFQNEPSSLSGPAISDPVYQAHMLRFFRMQFEELYLAEGVELMNAFEVTYTVKIIYVQWGCMYAQIDVDSGDVISISGIVDSVLLLEDLDEQIRSWALIPWLINRDTRETTLGIIKTVRQARDVFRRLRQEKNNLATSVSGIRLPSSIPLFFSSYRGVSSPLMPVEHFEINPRIVNCVSPALRERIERCASWEEMSASVFKGGRTAGIALDEPLALANRPEIAGLELKGIVYVQGQNIMPPLRQIFAWIRTIALNANNEIESRRWFLLRGGSGMDSVHREYKMLDALAQEEGYHAYDYPFGWGLYRDYRYSGERFGFLIRGVSDLHRVRVWTQIAQAHREELLEIRRIFARGDTRTAVSLAVALFSVYAPLFTAFGGEMRRLHHDGYVQKNAHLDNISWDGSQRVLFHDFETGHIIKYLPIRRRIAYRLIDLSLAYSQFIRYAFGTGGHFYTNYVLAEELRRRGDDPFLAFFRRYFAAESQHIDATILPMQILENFFEARHLSAVHEIRNTAMEMLSGAIENDRASSAVAGPSSLVTYVRNGVARLEKYKNIVLADEEINLALNVLLEVGYFAELMRACTPPKAREIFMSELQGSAINEVVLAYLDYEESRFWEELRQDPFAQTICAFLVIAIVNEAKRLSLGRAVAEESFQAAVVNASQYLEMHGVKFEKTSGSSPMTVSSGAHIDDIIVKSDYRAIDEYRGRLEKINGIPVTFYVSTANVMAAPGTLLWSRLGDFGLEIYFASENFLKRFKAKFLDKFHDDLSVALEALSFYKITVINLVELGISPDAAGKKAGLLTSHRYKHQTEIIKKLKVMQLLNSDDLSVAIASEPETPVARTVQIQLPALWHGYRMQFAKPFTSYVQHKMNGREQGIILIMLDKIRRKLEDPQRLLIPGRDIIVRQAPGLARERVGHSRLFYTYEDNRSKGIKTVTLIAFLWQADTKVQHDRKPITDGKLLKFLLQQKNYPATDEYIAQQVARALLLTSLQTQAEPLGITVSVDSEAVDRALREWLVDQLGRLEEDAWQWASSDMPFASIAQALFSRLTNLIDSAPILVQEIMSASPNREIFKFLRHQPLGQVLQWRLARAVALAKVEDEEMSSAQKRSRYSSSPAVAPVLMRTAMIIAEFDSTDDFKVVDMGSGDGSFLEAYSVRYPGHKIIGFENRVFYAGNAYLAPARLVIGDAGHTGLKDSSVDKVTINMPDPRGASVSLHRLLREAWRILRPGGELAVVFEAYDPHSHRSPYSVPVPYFDMGIVIRGNNFRLKVNGVPLRDFDPSYPTTNFIRNYSRRVGMNIFVAEKPLLALSWATKRIDEIGILKQCAAWYAFVDNLNRIEKGPAGGEGTVLRLPDSQLVLTCESIEATTENQQITSNKADYLEEQKIYKLDYDEDLAYKFGYILRETLVNGIVHGRGFVDFFYVFTEERLLFIVANQLKEPLSLAEFLERFSLDMGSAEQLMKACERGVNFARLFFTGYPTSYLVAPVLEGGLVQACVVYLEAEHAAAVSSPMEEITDELWGLYQIGDSKKFRGALSGLGIDQHALIGDLKSYTERYLRRKIADIVFQEIPKGAEKRVFMSQDADFVVGFEYNVLDQKPTDRLPKSFELAYQKGGSVVGRIFFLQGAEFTYTDFSWQKKTIEVPYLLVQEKLIELGARINEIEQQIRTGFSGGNAVAADLMRQCIEVNHEMYRRGIMNWDVKLAVNHGVTTQDRVVLLDTGGMTERKTIPIVSWYISLPYGVKAPDYERAFSQERINTLWETGLDNAMRSTFVNPDLAAPLRQFIAKAVENTRSTGGSSPVFVSHPALGSAYDAFAFSMTVRDDRPNQDCAYVDGNLGFLLVADGMGGRAAGEEASRLAAETITRVLVLGLPLANTLTDIEFLMDSAIGIANEIILTRQLSVAGEITSDQAYRQAGNAAMEAINQLLISGLSAAGIIADVVQLKNSVVSLAGEAIAKMPPVPKKARMGTTISAALIGHDDSGRRFLVARSIGDSRIYLITTTGEITQLSADDSYVAHLMRTQQVEEIVAQAVARLKQRENAIIAALGRVESRSLLAHQKIFRMLDPGDVILGASDGLWRNITLQRMQELFRDMPHAAVLVRALVDWAIAVARTPAGKADDISAAVIMIPAAHNAASPVDAALPVHYPVVIGSQLHTHYQLFETVKLKAYFINSKIVRLELLQGTLENEQGYIVQRRLQEALASLPHAPPTEVTFEITPETSLVSLPTIDQGRLIAEYDPISQTVRLHPVCIASEETLAYLLGISVDQAQYFIVSVLRDAFSHVQGLTQEEGDASLLVWLAHAQRRQYLEATLKVFDVSEPPVLYGIRGWKEIGRAHV
jgi:serine/threonine protein phosphatase PrpC/tRNA G46 methylase TrmB